MAQNLKSIARLEKKYIQEIQKHERTPWGIIFSVSILVDTLADPVFIGYFIKPFLWMELRDKGSPSKRTAMKGFMLIEFVPLANYLPLQIAATVSAYNNSKKTAKIARKKLNKLRKRKRYYG